jgi:hypothetical protein
MNSKRKAPPSPQESPPRKSGSLDSVRLTRGSIIHVVAAAVPGVEFLYISKNSTEVDAFTWPVAKALLVASSPDPFKGTGLTFAFDRRRSLSENIPAMNPPTKKEEKEFPRRIFVRIVPSGISTPESRREICDIVQKVRLAATTALALHFQPLIGCFPTFVFYHPLVLRRH